MPSGPNKRKSARKKKKKTQPSKSSASTPEHSPSDGESDDGSSASNSQNNSPLPPIIPKTREDDSPAKKSPTIERTEKDCDEKQGKIEIDRGSISQWPQEKISIPRSSSSDNKHRDKKKPVKIEPAPREKRQEKNDSKNNHAKGTGLEHLVDKLVCVDEKGSPKSKDCLTASTLNCPFCGRGGGGDRVIEHQTPDCPEKHPFLSPNPRAPEKASWSSCCGIFELCCSSRN